MLLSLWVVLSAMTRVDECAQHLVLKGGTLLRLRHGSWIGRVSKDLDLSLYADGLHQFRPEVITGEVQQEADGLLRRSLRDHGQISVRLEKTPDQAHPGNARMYGYLIRAQLGSTIARGRKFGIELAVDEYIDPDHLEHVRMQPMAELGLNLPIQLLAYDPVQAMAEKLRAILQKRQHFDRTGQEGGNFVPRHVTDLMFLHEQMRPGLIEDLPADKVAAAAEAEEADPPP